MKTEKTDLTVIFDFDGTLANTVELVVEIYNEHADEFNVKKVSKEDYSKLRKLGYKKSMKHLGISWYKVPRLMTTLRSAMKKQMTEVEPYEGIKPILNELKERGVFLGILTSNDSSLVQTFLDQHDFPVFDFLVSEKTLFGKEKALHRIMERHNLDKNRVIYIGDEPRDVVSSKKAGIKIFGVTWGLGGLESMESSKPDKTITTMKSLKKAILAEL